MPNKQVANAGKNGESKVPSEPDTSAQEAKASAPNTNTHADADADADRRTSESQRWDRHRLSRIEKRLKRILIQAQEQRQRVQDATQHSSPKPMQIEAWMRTNMREHPYRVIVATGGMSFLFASILMRRLPALFVGMVMGLLAGTYMGRLQSADPLKQTALAK